MTAATELLDPEAQAFLGSEVWNDARTVSHRLDRFLAGGGMSLTFLGTRRSPQAESTIVLKVMRPSFLRSASHAATLAMRKEAEALGRLNARTPPNPFVIRLVDVGAAWARGVEVPWIALEYVHGGPEGTTLRERVDTTIAATERSFDIARIARVMEQLRSALTEIHAAGIIHRDLKPENIFCCGGGVDEILKIADFGIARSTGMEATFGVGIGTLGYAAPEQLSADPSKVGPWTDVYALAAVMFHAISGIDCIDPDSPRRKLRSLLDPSYVEDDLRGRPSTLRALDELFKRSLSTRIEERPQSANEFAALLLGSLAVDSRAAPSAARPHRRSFEGSEEETWRWSVTRAPVSDRVVRGVAWNSDGRCLAATSAGLAFWNGAAWVDVPPNPTLANGMRFVRRLTPGEWLVGGDGATLAIFGSNGVEEVLQGPDRSYSIQLASGDLRDLAVLVFTRPGDPPTLYCLCHGRWLKPLPLEGVSMINAVTRVGDAEWFIVGRTTTGVGYAAYYAPLYWEVRPVAERTGAMLSCASHERSVIAGAVDGFVIAAIDSGDAGTPELRKHELVGRPPIGAVALDPVQRAWLATPGRVWLGWPARSTPFVPVWTSDDGQTPIVSIYADGGVVYAMTAEGAILEGRPEMAIPRR